MIDCKIVRFDETYIKSNFNIYYNFHDSPFGTCLIGFIKNENKEILLCHLAFADNNEKEVLERLKKKYLGAQFIEEEKETKNFIDKIFNCNSKDVTQIGVLLNGTNFQMNVWEALTTIPIGTLTTYAQIAQKINNPKAVRAVGSALKANKIAYVIPCHRVVCKSGCNKFSSGAQRKIKMQEYEKKLIANETTK